MADKKNKKRLILILLVAYVLISVGLAVMYKLEMQPFEGKEKEAEREKQMAALEEHLVTVYPDISEEQVYEMHKTLYGVPGSVMSLNLTIIMQLVGFLALMGFLYLLLWEPLIKFLDERRQSIQDDIDSAKGKKEEADEVLREYRRKLHDARDDVASLIEDGRKRGEEKEREIIGEARHEVERLQKRAGAELREEVEVARRQLRKEFAAISVDIAEKILDREVNEKDHHAFVEEALQGLESEGVKF